MNRSKLLTGITLLSSSFVMAGERPNVLIIMTDEHSYRTIGAYRELAATEQEANMWGKGNIVETPNIDRLAHSGVTFTKYYASFPVSSPSRSSMMSGLYNHATGVFHNDLPMNKEVVTFAQSMLDADYKTGYIGKWHLDGDAKPGWGPKANGGFEENKYMCNRGHWKIVKDNKAGNPMELDNKNGKYDRVAFTKKVNEKNFTTDFLTAKTIDFIDRNKDENFLCVLSIPDPHGPNYVREPYASMYKNMDFKRPISATQSTVNGVKWSKATGKKGTIIDKRGEMAQYYGMVKCVDDNVGKILKYLDDNNLTDNTLIIYTADHGDLLGEHKRDDKGVPFEASVKIPMIWSYPKKIAKGIVQSKPMNNTDFTPTLLDFVGVESDVKYHGESQVDTFVGRKVNSNQKGITIFRSESWVAATNGKRKLVYTEGEGSKIILFDLEKGDMEMTNEYNNSKFAKEIKSLAQAIAAYAKAYDEPLWGDPKILQEVLHDAQQYQH